MAKTTRFYEACYFKKPMITLEGTQDSYYVKEKGIGMVLDLSNIDTAVEQLSRLTLREIEEMIQHYNEVPAPIYTYNNEHEELLNKLEI